MRIWQWLPSPSAKDGNCEEGLGLSSNFAHAASSSRLALPSWRYEALKYRRRCVACPRYTRERKSFCD